MRCVGVRARAAGLAAGLLAATAMAQKWNDRGEYELALAVRSESVAAKRLKLIDEWKKKYPSSEVRGARAELELESAQSEGAWDRVRKAAAEILAAAPDSLTGLYWTVLLTAGAGNLPASELAGAEKAAQRLLANLDKYFAASAAPPDAPAAEWARRRTETETLAHRTLGWIELQQRSHAAAESEFTACLQKDPNDAQSSAWLGGVLAVQKTPEKQTAALWHLARAAYSDGEHSLSGARRQEAGAALEKFYTAFHGSPEGLKELGASAKGAVFPPAGFRVETAAEIAARRAEEEFARTNPEAAAWAKLRKRLDSGEGNAYFAEFWQDRSLPALKGRVVRCAPASRPKEIFLSMGDAAEAEVRLILDGPFPNKAEAGVELRFEANAVSFTREPFLLTVSAAREKVSGWPGTN